MGELTKLVRASQAPGLPPDESIDLNAAVWGETVKAVEGDHLSAVRQSIDWLRMEGDLLHKAFRMQPYSYSLDHQMRDDVLARRGKWRDRGHTAILQVNDYGVVVPGVNGGKERWVEKRGTAGGFAFLEQVLAGIDIIKAVIVTRQRQLTAFCRPERDSAPLGFRFVRRDGEKMKDSDIQLAKRLESLVMNCGDEDKPWVRERLQRQSMAGFVRNLVWDSMGYDACPIEIEHKNNGRLAGFYNVDGSTVRLCTESGYEGNDKIRAIQVIDQAPHVAFTYEDLVYQIRNPRPSVKYNGYGMAESEMVVKVLTAWLNSFQYNAAGLSRNAIPRGLLAMFGDFDQRALNNFGKNLQDMLEGPGNRFKLPVIAGGSKQQGGARGGAQYIKIDSDFNEAHFTKWMSLLISIVCACYSIDPGEINMQSFSGSNSSPLSGKDTEEKLAHSRDKGLIPLIMFVEELYNDWIIPRETDLLKMEFIGLHEEDPQYKNERIKLSSTIDEIREIDGKKPMEDERLGKAPSNPALMQVYMMGLQQDMQGDMGGGEGPADGGGPEFHMGEDEGADDDDYPQDEQGNHAPYGKEAAPGDDHFHTLDSGGLIKSQVTKQKGFVVVIEKGVEGGE